MTTHDPAVVPVPADDDVRLDPPEAPEVQRLALGVAATITAPDTPMTILQHAVMEATFASMTGHRPDLTMPATSVDDLVDALRDRNLAFRTRLVQQALLGALIVDPIEPAVVQQIRVLGGRLGVDDGMIDTATQLADGQFELAAIDFDRNGYTADWDVDKAANLHATRPLDVPWRAAPDDAELAARWQALEALPEGSLGQQVSRFYRARGFNYPGRPGSVSPLLAQHDWVHVLADYGSVIENELEVFAFIARANDDPKGFSFLAMVVSLFETGVLATGAGLFTPDAGHLRIRGMPERLADAMLRGARCDGSVDFLGIDWFALADQDVDELRRHFGITPKAAGIGSPGPFEPGGLNEYQLTAGRAAAEREGRHHETWGASSLERSVG
jgi:hypothetical protein